jgi:hypothetical protein
MSHRIGDNDVIFDNRWKDQLGSVYVARRSGLTEEAYRDTGHIMQFFRYNSPGVLGFEVQINHDWDLDTSLHVHIHLIPMANGAGNVYFTYQYAFAGVGGTYPALAGWTTGSATHPIVAADQYTHDIAELFTFTPTGGTPSSILLLDITRDTDNILDTYETNKDHGTPQANLAALYIDVHYQVIQAGTVTEYA